MSTATSWGPRGPGRLTINHGDTFHMPMKRMKPRNREVLDLLVFLNTVTPMDAQRAIGISGGGLTKALSDLRHVHGYVIRKVTKTDPITGTRYPQYSLAGRRDQTVLA